MSHTFEKPLPVGDYVANVFTKSFYLWSNCADDNMVQKIIDLGESLDQMQAKVGGTAEKSKEDDKTRISTLSWIGKNDETNFLYDFIIDKIDRINYWHFGFKLTGMESFQYTRYPIGGHYIYHNDIIFRETNTSRKLSIVMGLTDPSTYVGGDLLLNPHGNTPTKIRFKKGDLVAFPSFVPHKVEPVTEGQRITLVSWITGPKFV